MGAMEKTDAVRATEVAGYLEQTAPDAEIVTEEPKAKPQKRLMSKFLSKRVPAVPCEEERKYFPQKRNPLSYTFFWWLNPLYGVGYKRTIVPEDLWKLNDDQLVEYHFGIFEQHFARQMAKWKASQKDADGEKEWPVKLIVMAIFHTFRVRILMTVLLSLCNQYTIIFLPLVNKKLIQFVEAKSVDPSMSSGPGVGYAICNALLTLLLGLFYNHMFDLSTRCSIDVRAVLIKFVLAKSMRLSARGRHDFPEAKITSVIGNDVTRIEYAFTIFSFIASITPGMITVIALLIVNIGVAALVGIGLMLLICVLQALGATFLIKYRVAVNTFTDKRVFLIKEVLNNFKMIKFYSWERAYLAEIKRARGDEMQIVRKMKIALAIMIVMAIGLPLLSSMLSFLTLYKIRGVSNIASIYASLTWFSVLSENVSFLPQCIAAVADASVAFKRIAELLRCEEYEQQSPVASDGEDTDSNTVLELKDASFEWETFDDKEDEKEQQKDSESDSAAEQMTAPTPQVGHFSGLHGLSFSVDRGEFVLVSGAIGSGKSSLLNAISGNMKKTAGTLKLRESALFYGEPWIQSGTIRDNITFTSPYDEKRYQEVIDACALADDLQNLPAGSETEIGERGITLSGGQKARLSLARAVYSDRQILLFDDVLSAVDAKVANHIVDRCFNGFLKGRTRILATHQISLVNSSTKVVFLCKDGTVDTGTLEEVKARNAEFMRLLEFGSTGAVDGLIKSSEDPTDAAKAADKPVGDGLLVEEESRLTNMIPLGVYKTFLLKGAGRLKLGVIPMLVVLAMVGTFYEQFNTVWLTFWTEYRYDISNAVYMGLYIMFSFSAVVATLAQFLAWTFILNAASKNIVVSALERLLHAPTSFMDVTPMGRVLNRFTKDTEVIDNELFVNTVVLLYPLCYLIGVTVMAVVYLPWLLIAMPFLFALFIVTTDFSQSTAREIKRIEAVKRSFIFNNITEVLNGLTTIRAYGAQDQFMKRNDDAINNSNEAYYLTVSCQRWLSSNLTIVACLFGLMVSVMCATGVFNLSASTTGLLLSAMIGFYGCLTSVFRSLTAFEITLNSVERLNEYSEELVQEAPFEIPASAPAPEWPAEPDIEFRNVSMRYRPELPPVLKDLSFRVAAHSKVGICGRTGAGKSSVMSALYRLNEIDSGQILIDGVDIGQIGLRDLRTKLTIIPQDTALFKGTLRYNIDPFAEHDDARLYSALQKSGLHSPQGPEHNLLELESKIEENGSNLSLGQKQLIALARALARDTQILILDEATSSVDYETDVKIQTTIRTEFADCTILCIAHRLQTILDYDQIMVLDAGRIVEFDTPKNLFQNRNSLFREMCNHAKIAEQDFAYFKRQG